MGQNDLLVESIEYTNAVVKNMANVDWQSRTTCPPWTLHDLLNHITYEWLWAPPLFAGKTVAEVGDKYEGDVLGVDPLESYKKAASIFLAAAKKVDPEKTVHLSYADVPASEYMFQLTTEALIHGWDLAVSSGQKAVIPAKLAKELYKIALSHQKDLADAGVYGQKVSVNESDNLQTRLLALFGRKNMLA